ncbi:MAG: OmpA family protein [Candidatus Tectomicrobia bacterium]|nr:OmpA family protein [Candidatus Tectomicrobia bacterium]
MQKQVAGWVGCLTCFVLVGCVSKRKYVDLEADLTQQLQQTSETLQNTERKLQQAEEARAQSEAELAELQGRYATLQTDAEERRSLLALQRNIEQELKEQIANQSVKIETLEGKLKVSFIDRILFRTGSAKINAQGRETLLKVADLVRQDTDHLIMVEGHTDDVPIGIELQPTFPTNWELSTARATAVVRFLHDQGDIAPQRLSASGYSYYRPVASHETEEGRRQNRRIEILLVPSKLRS